MALHNSKAKTLLHWTVHLSSTNAIYVEGICPELEDSEIWHTNAIVKRIDSHFLETASGAHYLLVDNMDLKRAEEENVPSDLIKYFSHGFPSNWKTLLNVIKRKLSKFHMQETHICSFESRQKAPSRCYDPDIDAHDISVGIEQNTNCNRGNISVDCLTQTVQMDDSLSVTGIGHRTLVDGGNSVNGDSLKSQYVQDLPHVSNLGSEDKVVTAERECREAGWLDLELTPVSVCGYQSETKPGRAPFAGLPTLVCSDKINYMNTEKCEDGVVRRSRQPKPNLAITLLNRHFARRASSLGNRSLLDKSKNFRNGQTQTVVGSVAKSVALKPLDGREFNMTVEADVLLTPVSAGREPRLDRHRLAFNRRSASSSPVASIKPDSLPTGQQMMPVENSAAVDHSDGCLNNEVESDVFGRSFWSDEGSVSRAKPVVTRNHRPKKASTVVPHAGECDVLIQLDNILKVTVTQNSKLPIKPCGLIKGPRISCSKLRPRRTQKQSVVGERSKIDKKSLTTLDQCRMITRSASKQAAGKITGKVAEGSDSETSVVGRKGNLRCGKSRIRVVRKSCRSTQSRKSTSKKKARGVVSSDLKQISGVSDPGNCGGSKRKRCIEVTPVKIRCKRLRISLTPVVKTILMSHRADRKLSRDPSAEDDMWGRSVGVEQRSLEADTPQPMRKQKAKRLRSLSDEMQIQSLSSNAKQTSKVSLISLEELQLQQDENSQSVLKKAKILRRSGSRERQTQTLGSKATKQMSKVQLISLQQLDKENLRSNKECVHSEDCLIESMGDLKLAQTLSGNTHVSSGPPCSPESAKRSMKSSKRSRTVRGKEVSRKNSIKNSTTPTSTSQLSNAESKKRSRSKSCEPKIKPPSLLGKPARIHSAQSAGRKQPMKEIDLNAAAGRSEVSRGTAAVKSQCGKAAVSAKPVTLADEPPKLTGGRGTLKRRRELQALIEHHEQLQQSSHADFFLSTPFRCVKTITCPGLLSELDDGLFNLSSSGLDSTVGRTCRTPHGLYRTSGTNYTMTPSQLSTTDTPQALLNSVNRNDVDVYLYRLQKKKKTINRKSRKNIAKAEPAFSQHTHATSVQPVNSELFNLQSTNSQYNTHDESDLDDYFDDV